MGKPLQFPHQRFGVPQQVRDGVPDRRLQGTAVDPGARTGLGFPSVVDGGLEAVAFGTVVIRISLAGTPAHAASAGMFHQAREQVRWGLKESCPWFDRVANPGSLVNAEFLRETMKGKNWGGRWSWGTAMR